MAPVVFALLKCLRIQWKRTAPRLAVECAAVPAFGPAPGVQDLILFVGFRSRQHQRAGSVSENAPEENVVAVELIKRVVLRPSRR